MFFSKKETNVDMVRFSRLLEVLFKFMEEVSSVSQERRLQDSEAGEGLTVYYSYNVSGYVLAILNLASNH